MRDLSPVLVEAPTVPAPEVEEDADVTGLEAGFLPPAPVAATTADAATSVGPPPPRGDGDLLGPASDAEAEAAAVGEKACPGAASVLAGAGSSSRGEPPSPSPAPSTPEVVQPRGDPGQGVAVTSEDSRLASLQHREEELRLEKNQHELEVEAWSRHCREQEDSLALHEARLDAFAEKLWAQGAQVASREGEVNAAEKKLQKLEEELAQVAIDLDLERERLEKLEDDTRSMEERNQKSVESFNAKLATARVEREKGIQDQLKAGRDNYRKEVQAEFSKKLKVLEGKFLDRK